MFHHRRNHVELMLSFESIKDYLYTNENFEFYNHRHRFKKKIDRDDEH